MNNQIHISRATKELSAEVAVLAGELLQEIMERIGSSVFAFNLEESKERLGDFIAREKNFVFGATKHGSDELVGFVTIYEGYAVYAEGAFGVMAELYVKPKYRSCGIGKMLICAVKEFGAKRGWKRIEVTTPPLPQFDETLAFYEREGFEISGGRKLKSML